MQLPAWCRLSAGIHLIESISKIDSNRSERAHKSRAKPRASEKPSGIELARMTPDVSTFEKCIEIQRLIHPQAQFCRSDKERVTERRSLRPRSIRDRRIVSDGRNRELVVPAKRLTVLGSADRECL